MSEGRREGKRTEEGREKKGGGREGVGKEKREKGED